MVTLKPQRNQITNNSFGSVSEMDCAYWAEIILIKK